MLFDDAPHDGQGAVQDADSGLAPGGRDGEGILLPHRVLGLERPLHLGPAEALPVPVVDFAQRRFRQRFDAVRRRQDARGLHLSGVAVYLLHWLARATGDYTRRRGRSRGFSSEGEPVSRPAPTGYREQTNRRIGRYGVHARGETDAVEQRRLRHKVRRKATAMRMPSAQCYWQTVPAGGCNSSRVMFLVCVTPLTVYVKAPALPSEKVKSAVPTIVPVAPPGVPVGGNGIALNGGPVARTSCPE